MKLFFDTEFTGLHKDTSLISLGIISEDGKRFYAENTSYSFNQCDSWIKENVLKKTIMFGNNTSLKDNLFEDEDAMLVIGSKDMIKSHLLLYLASFDDVQFISDVCHYDFVLLIDIFGDAFKLPDFVSPVCYDINQDIARYYKISDKEAFNKSREEIVCELHKWKWDEITKSKDKHSSMFDAEIIKLVYEGLKERGLYF